MAQLVNAGCAALNYYTDMLFRCFAVILIAASVLVSGSRAPQGRPAKASGAAPVTRQLDSSDAQNTDAALAPSHEDASTNVDLKNLIDAHAHFAAGVIHEMNLEAESALDDYYNAALLDPTNEELVLDVAQQFLQAKRPEKALDLLSRASTNPAASGALFAEMGFVYSKLGRTNEAVAADRAAIRKDPRSIAGYQSLFLDFSQNKQTSEIWTLLDEASRVRGADAEFLIGLAELYFHMGIDSPQDKSTADARALSLLQRAAKTNPSDLRLQLRLAEGFVRLGKTDDAARFYEVAVKQLPDTAPQYDAVHEELANIYLQNHDTRRAAEQLEIVARDNPTDAQTYYKLGGIAYENTNYVKAMDYFRNAILFSPDFELAYYNLATAQMGADKTADALETLGRARRRFSQNFMGEYLSGMACSQEKDFTNALQHFTTAEILAKNTDPSRLTDTFYFQLGAACERTGDYARAETYFSNCLKLAPDSAEALNYLGFMWADRGEKLDKARDLISRALKSDPKNAAYLDSMAWVLYKLHQNKPALDYALKAIQFSEEEDATVYDHLGDIYNALGQKDKARQAWNKSLSLEADETVRKKIDSAGK
ncbi:MAG TPA: tetratricopeptide repeat protein [Verrucomicrobiae bacterium]|nr:tetratricopeptide repeat protein [Verrucomicrobiae bacterium]